MIKPLSTKKNLTPTNPSLEEMRTEKVVYNIAMRPKNHHGKNETQGCQCIYHIDLY
jgi:hypothetical protein